jgi:formylmethanofuran dehydrogenase subunit C
VIRAPEPRVVLAPRGAPDGTVEVESLAPDRLAALGEREIAALPAWRGAARLALGDLFDVRGGRAERLVMQGGAPHLRGLGAGMAGGMLIVEGDAGDGVGLGMSGGTILVEGSAGDDLGGAAPGASRGMTGGEIVVRGRVGRGVGERMRRGLIAVGGDAGEDAGGSAIAGTVIILGSAGAGAARGSKRGTLVVMGDVEIPFTFRYACTYSPPHLRLTLAYLRRRFGAAVEDRHLDGAYRRYSGDLAELGRGEILRWTGA